MNQYDFLLFSPPEFELFVKDLLEATWKTHIEIFADAADGGIDLRFTDNRNQLTIIQCKRYKSATPLIGSLRKEVKRIKRLKPDRYLVVTAIDLTDTAKQKIGKMFKSAALKEKDIIGRKDLNKFLSRQRAVEERFFKLWINSTNVLKRILKSRLYNYNEFKREEIQKLSKFYVTNNSFPEALEKLNTHRYCILSGIPGIGKSTLTKILACYLLSQGYEELIYLNSSFEDAWELGDKNCKQVFIFDDFLGKIIINGKLEFNEDRSLLDFIELIKNSKNAVLILATRENILNLAKIQYEQLNNPRLELAKCIIDLGTYTIKVRALILANHLFHSGMPQDYIEHLLRNKFYIQLLNHRNYSPRIIETLTIGEVWQSTPAEEIQQLFLSAFNNPHAVWKHAFDHQLKPISRCLLYVMVTIGEPILAEDIRKALQNFLQRCGSNYNAQYAHISFDNALKELHNCFISSEIDAENQTGIFFQNPSVQDFLLHEIAGDERIIADIIAEPTYLNQLLCPGCWKKPSYKAHPHYITWIASKKKFLKIQDILLQQFNNLIYYQVDTVIPDKKAVYRFDYKSRLEILREINFIIKEMKEDWALPLKYFIINELQLAIDQLPIYLGYTEKRALIDLIKQYHSSIILDEYKIMESLCESVYYFSDLIDINKIARQLPRAWKKIRKNKEGLKTLLDKASKAEAKYINKNRYNDEMLLDSIKRIGKSYNLDIIDEWKSLAAKITHSEIDEENLELIDVPLVEEELSTKSKEKHNEIDMIFERLKSNKV